MKVLDITAAILIGTSSLLTLLVWTPTQYTEATSTSSQDAALRNYALETVTRLGLAFLSNSTTSQVCAGLQSASNSTVEVSGSVGGASCGPVPSGVHPAELDLPLNGRSLVVEAWYAGRG